ncbi:conserved hypothetical protein [Pseudomonas sp. OF001]|uniref:hypothetical protein n=1 Tax=Pseudomonas sp. OF001 TaxID=2772300 RepID=UPI0019181D44|nr:hypothetical protein [Pseudomonas sp. OF001]CAD5377166.1 conserved hypothetical protein [Pseudomonas sp. OF001]
MPVYMLSDSENGASVRIDGVEVAAFVKNVERPLISIPLRARRLNASVFAGEKAKLKRARQHFGELVALVNEYMAVQPFRFSEIGDSIIGCVEKQVPQEINIVLGDVVHNLRSTLDLLVCDLVQANGRKVSKDSAFPMWVGGIQPWHAEKQLAGVSQRAFKVLFKITKNQLWNEALLMLHGLDIMDKHRALVAVGAATVRVHANIGMPGLFIGPSGEIRFGGPGPDGAPFLRKAGSPVGFTTTFLTEQEMEVYRYVPDIPQDVEVACDLVFGPGEKGAGAPILQTLDMLSNVIERILVLCERRAL